jgi:hypothetical protein
MQESEFTGCANKVQGKPRNPAKLPTARTALYPGAAEKRCAPKLPRM